MVTNPKDESNGSVKLPKWLIQLYSFFIPVMISIAVIGVGAYLAVRQTLIEHSVRLERIINLESDIKTIEDRLQSHNADPALHHGRKAEVDAHLQVLDQRMRRLEDRP